ncbi:Two-component response regulator, YesN/AraC family, consists of REC and AraC-type DNA-binding domains [Anaerovirgula multivorans]|uniref:Stage 0 sporulation protein A homolog n=1 Tax=Anaerovirgula multivorans TaxID=312168 RepID=A0A239AM74_9FIRM|nr:response regulator [Anaerovirgula multivorans]SNR96757.1 Two-component response regulator, YesN/AraC family, consists of REC and AraC-type DNA-binding domains [Anaerovirgula multivorans]
MLQLMIIEDEMIERKALKFLINKYYKDKIQVCGEASNGNQAIEKALNLRPDIVMADIRIPGITGLEASHLIKTRLPNTEILILTAYDDFEYAKKAIHIGINDYLLKPVSDEEFCGAMDKIIEKVNVKKENVEKERSLRKQINQLMPLLEKEMILKLILGEDLSANQLEEYKNIFNVKSNHFICIIFRGSEEDEDYEEILKVIKNKLKFVSRETLGSLYLKNMVFLLFHNHLQELINNKNLIASIKEIRYQVEEKFQFQLYFGIGSSHEDTSKLYNSYREAKSTMEKQMEEVDHDKNELVDKDLLNIVYEKEMIIFEKLLNEDLIGAVNEFENILDYVTTNTTNNKNLSIEKYIQQFCLIINRNIIHFFGKALVSLEIQKMEREIQELKETTEIKEYIKNLLKEVVFAISQYKTDSNTRAIESVKKYVRENYMKDISLNDVADYIELSSYYLSRLFKKIEGENFKDYLIKTRMEKAKQLLREERKSIKETALEVGYEDPNYFSRAFKKYVGIPATEYAKL